MAIRILINTFLIAVLLLGGTAEGADRKSPKSTRNLEITPPSIPLSDLGKILLKKEPLSHQKKVSRPGDFWNPEILQKIKVRN